MIPGSKKTTPRRIPDDERELALQMQRAVFSPFSVRSQNEFRVRRLRLKGVAQLLAKSRDVKNRRIGNNSGKLVRRRY
jgi:hypothetical protein